MQKQIPPSEFVDKYYKRCGISGAFKAEQFWRMLHKNFGSEAKIFDDCIVARENGVAVNPYPPKNHSLKLSNAIAAQYDAEFIKAFAIWIIKEGLPEEGTVLEVGCENGLLLCLLASRYPDAKFIGVDICEEAINVATERAQQLGLSNIKFYTSSIEKSSDVTGVGSCDRIISSKVFHEILFGALSGEAEFSIEKDIGTNFSIDEADSAITNSIHNLKVIDVLRNLLTNDGLLISVDRWARAEMTLFWVRLIESHGFNLSLNLCDLLTVKGGHECHYWRRILCSDSFQEGHIKPKVSL